MRALLGNREHLLASSSALKLLRPLIVGAIGNIRAVRISSRRMARSRMISA